MVVVEVVVVGVVVEMAVVVVVGVMVPCRANEVNIRAQRLLSVWGRLINYAWVARYSIVLLRPKNEVKPLTQSAKLSICMGKWAVPNWGNLFLGLPKGPRRLDFFRKSVRFQCPP